MIITVASGKGGTGKTTVATNLSLVAGSPVRLLDCDVEEPNCHIFMKPEIDHRSTVEVMIPDVDAAKCTACGKCAEICRFSAIVSAGTTPMVFPELCHSCYGCMLVCPEKAISEGKRLVGEIERGRAGDVEYVGGRVRIGETMSPPLIRKVKESVDFEGLVIVDAPPGTSCPVIEAVKRSDFVLLVTEPTPFGLHDLDLAVLMTRELGLKCGVVINRAGIGGDMVHDYCREAGVQVLMEIPDDRRIAEAYSRGEAAVRALPEYRVGFEKLLADLKEEVSP